MEPIAEALGVDQAMLRRLVMSVALIAGLLILRWLVLRWLHAQLDDPEDQYRATKLTNATLTVIGLISLIFIWVDAFGSLATFLGLVSAGIAVALGDLLKNMAAWAYIMTRRPFGVGDRVEVQGTRGDVADIRLFRFTLMEIGKWVDGDQPNGRLVHVPNGIVFTDQLANYTEGFEQIWDEVKVTFTFESDVAVAEQILYDVMDRTVPEIDEVYDEIKEMSQEYRLDVPSLDDQVLVRVDDSGVTLFGRYVVDTSNRREISTNLWRELARAVNDEPRVAFAYPTMRTYFESPIEITNR